MNGPSLSLVIVSYNTRELLRQCLESVRGHEPAAQVIVADNASRDGSPEMIREAFPHVELVEMGRNAGFAAANNAALERSRGDFVVLLNSDTVLVDDTLSRCAAWMAERGDIGAASPRLIGTDDQTQPCLFACPRLGDVVRQAVRLTPRAEADETPGWLSFRP